MLVGDVVRDIKLCGWYNIIKTHVGIGLGVNLTVKQLLQKLVYFRTFYLFYSENKFPVSENEIFDPLGNVFSI